MLPPRFLSLRDASLACAALLALAAIATVVVGPATRSARAQADVAANLEQTAQLLEEARFAEGLAEIERALATAPVAERAAWRLLRSRALRLAGRAQEPLALEDALHAVEAARASGAALASAHALFELGALHLVRDAVAEAEAALDAALVACSEAGEPGAVRRSEILVYRAECAYARGDLPLARQHQRAAAAIQDRILEPLDPRVAFRLTREANLAHALGDDRGALAHGERALAAYRAHLRPDHPRIAVVLHNLGVYHQSLRDLPAAARAFEAALEIRAAAGSPLAARTLALLAQVRGELGDAGGARRWYVESIASLERSGGERAAALYVPLRSLALLALREGEHEEARAAALRSLEVLDADPLARVEERVEITAILGHVAWRTGRPDEAIALWEGARAELERAGAVRSLAGVEILVQSGLAEVAQGRAQSGLELLERALDAHRRLRGAAHPDVAWTLKAVAEAAQAAGDGERAFAGALEAAAIVRRHLDTCVPELDERDALGYATEYTPGLALAVVLAAQAPATRAASAWEAVIAARAAVFEAARDRRARLGGTRCEEPSSREGAGSRTASALARIASERPAGTALLAFVRCSRPDAYVAFVLPAEASEPTAVELGSAAEIDRWCGPLRTLARSPGSEAAWREHATALRRRIWDPLAAHLRGAREILLVPDGAFLLFDFAGLPDGEGGYLVESAPPIHVLGAERDVLGAAQRDRDAGPLGVLALGAPEFGAAREPAGPGFGASTGPGVFVRLPEAEREVRAIVDLWHDAGVPARALVGADASEAGLRGALSGVRILHVATHGFAEGSTAPLGARGLASEAPGPLWSEPLRLELSRRHLGRSALALAGANSAVAHDPRADGLLSDAEVLELDLAGLDLAVLSACDTGSGEVQSGEGIFGLRRAFQLAGARAVVAALWPVGDEDARVLMTDFHARLAAGGTSAARALHEAKRAELARRRAAQLDTHPWHWAGFVVAGAPVRIR
ncbi:MAG: CHAT domain-containing protein [Planctomycetes bacterium]|nr:CHAT domain-containing protein [Planctomycetota bacterium]